MFIVICSSKGVTMIVVSMLCLVLSVRFGTGGELDDCYNQYPSIRGRMTWEQYMLQCLKKRQYYALSGEREPFLEESSFFTDKQLKYLHSFDDDLSSMVPLSAAVRREYRDMDQKDRNAFHRSLRQLADAFARKRFRHSFETVVVAFLKNVLSTFSDWQALLRNALSNNADGNSSILTIMKK